MFFYSTHESTLVTVFYIFDNTWFVIHHQSYQQFSLVVKSSSLTRGLERHESKQSWQFSLWGESSL